MVSHRPHPISGPWPHGYPNDGLAGKRAVDAGYTRRQGVRLCDRVPIDESLIYDDPEDAVLFDGCARCRQHAAAPMYSLDDANLATLWRRMVEVERDRTARAYYRTRNEAAACRRLYDVAILVARSHEGIDPWRWPWTVRVDQVQAIIASTGDAFAKRQR